MEHFSRSWVSNHILRAGDWDGTAEVSVFRNNAVGSQIFFYYRGTSNNPNGSITFLLWETTGDKSLAGDYDGDGKADIAVWRPANGVWYQQRSSTGFGAVQFKPETNPPKALTTAKAIHYRTKKDARINIARLSLSAIFTLLVLRILLPQKRTFLNLKTLRTLLSNSKTLLCLRYDAVIPIISVVSAQCYC